MVHKDFGEFIKTRHPKIMMWAGANTNAEEVYSNNMANLGKA